MNTVNQILNNFLQEEEKKVVNELVKFINKTQFEFCYYSNEFQFFEEVTDCHATHGHLNYQNKFIGHYIYPSKEGGVVVTTYKNIKFVGEAKEVYVPLDKKSKKKIVKYHEKNIEKIKKQEYLEEYIEEYLELIKWLKKWETL